MKIYNDAVDKNVAVNVVYCSRQAINDGASATERLYVAHHDKELTKPVKSEELENLYLKGLVVCQFSDESYAYFTPSVCTLLEGSETPIMCLALNYGFAISDPEEFK